MSTYTQIFYHIIFSTKNREASLKKENREQVYKFISGILKNNKCVPYAIGGVEDHIHILTHLHPTKALSSIIKDIKIASSIFIKNNHQQSSFRDELVDLLEEYNVQYDPMFLH